MTTSRAPRVSSSRVLRNRIVRLWRTFFAPGDWFVLPIIMIMLLMPALALEAAGWPLSMRTIIPVAMLSVGFGFLLARSNYNELLALLVSTIYGGSFILLIAAINEPGGVVAVVERTTVWIRDAVSGGINQDTLVFTLLVATLFWFLGYNAVWHVFRLDRMWRVIIPPGFILLANTVFYAGNASLDFYIIVFMFMALLLIVRSNLDAREWDWYVNGIRVPRQVRAQVMRIGAILAAVVLLVAWIVPSGDLQGRLDSFQQFLQSEPIAQFSETLNRLFSPIDTQGPATADYYGGDTLNLGGAIRLGDQVIFQVNAPNNRRYYWRSRTFDVYQGGTWVTLANRRYSDEQEPMTVGTNAETIGAAREAVTQEFTIGLNASRLIYAAPQPVEINLAGRIDMRYVDVVETAMNVSVIRPIQVLGRGDRYTAVSMVSVATANDLRNTGRDYPTWVTEIYLIVSDTTTERTRQLAQQIVTDAGATTVYDQARAIERWLRANIDYNELIPAPPPGRDAVDWVLFDQQEGYCVYYATAMVMMLRHLGIPARMVAGFAQGEWDAQQGQFVVRERDAHTWVEVYFPGYGWIEFEPTSAQQPLTREGDEDEAQFQPQPPQPTSTPLPSPTPTITPTAPPTQPNDQSQPPPPPTITPTFTPTATVTPVIVVTQPPPLQPEPEQNFLSFLLPAFGLAFLALMLIVLLVVIGALVYWWWEWRGMGGLSPVARAYARLERYIGLIGIQTNDKQTPDEKRKFIVRRLPPAERPVTAITRMYTVEKYGQGSRNNHPAGIEQRAQAADNAWPDARGHILRRWLQRLLPWRRNDE